MSGTESRTMTGASSRGSRAASIAAIIFALLASSSAIFIIRNAGSMMLGAPLLGTFTCCFLAFAIGLPQLARRLARRPIHWLLIAACVVVAFPLSYAAMTGTWACMSSREITLLERRMAPAINVLSQSADRDATIPVPPELAGRLRVYRATSDLVLVVEGGGAGIDYIPIVYDARVGRWERWPNGGTQDADSRVLGMTQTYPALPPRPGDSEE